MKIAFLLLTYSNPLFDKILKLKNIYIHPKYPDKVNEKFKKYVIPEKYHIETKWGDMSIVSATINLLDYASQEDYDYYILLSEDTYSLYKLNKLINIIESLNDKSAFEFVKKYDGMYKSYQWWFLNKEDAHTIIKTKYKYKNIFFNKSLDGAPDENYFLTVLNRENSNYKYVNQQNIFTRWIHDIPIKHPFIFNKLTKQDIKIIKKTNTFFIRKCTKDFTIKKYNTKSKLAIVLIGTSTNQEIIKKNTVDYDIIIINATDDNTIIDESLQKKSIYIINVIWKFYDLAIKNLLKEYSVILNQWKEILITSETYNFNIANIKKDGFKTILYDSNNQRAQIIQVL